MEQVRIESKHRNGTERRKNSIISLLAFPITCSAKRESALSGSPPISGDTGKRCLYVWYGKPELLICLFVLKCITGTIIVSIRNRCETVNGRSGFFKIVDPTTAAAIYNQHWPNE